MAELESDRDDRTGRGVVVVLVPDVFFLVGIRNVLRHLRYEVMVMHSTDELADTASVVTPVLVLIDLHAIGAGGDWDAVEPYLRRRVPVLAFGPHRDVDGFRAAKDAGVTRVISNGQFHREMAEIIERYASNLPDNADGDEELDEFDDESTGSLPPGMARPSPSEAVGDG